MAADLPMPTERGTGSMKSVRLFYALWPDHATRAALVRWQDHVQGRKTARENLHITLAFLGQQPTTLIPTLQAILASLPPPDMTLVLDRLGYFSRHRIAWAGIQDVPDALMALQQTLTQALAQHGIAFNDQSGFRPHVTLARDALAPADVAVEKIHWRVGELVLAQSTTDRDGTCYRVLATQESNKDG
jgi:2'-5' RNA ligase